MSDELTHSKLTVVNQDFVNIPLLVTAPAGHEVMRIEADGTLVVADATEAAEILLRAWHDIRRTTYPTAQEATAKLKKTAEGLRITRPDPGPLTRPLDEKERAWNAALDVVLRAWEEEK
jgi:hypothetical protein